MAGSGHEVVKAQSLPLDLTGISPFSHPEGNGVPYMHCQGLKLQEHQYQAIQGSAQVAKGDSCYRNKSPETNSNQNTQSLRNASPLGRRILPKLRSDACSTCNVIWDWILSAVRSKKPFLFLATPPSLQVPKTLTLNGSHSRQSPPAARRRPASGTGKGGSEAGRRPIHPNFLSWPHMVSSWV